MNNPIPSVDLFGEPISDVLSPMLVKATGYGSHRPLLVLALSWFNTRGAGTPRLGTIYEFGTGHGSTPFLQDVSRWRQSTLVSLDSDEEWFFKFYPREIDRPGPRGVIGAITTPRDAGIVRFQGWDDVPLDTMGPRSIDIALIDHAPGERRHVELTRLIDKATFVVVHDSEQDGAGDYKLEPVLWRYAYRLNDYPGGAGTTLVSNYVDVTSPAWVEGLAAVRSVANLLA